MNKKFTKILICPAFLAGMMMFSCTEVEKIEVDHNGGYNTMNNAESEAYYASLRAYKDQMWNYGRPVAFGWFSDWSPTGASRGGYLTSVPDSMDIISMWSGAPGRFEITPEQKADKEFVQKKKGIKKVILATAVLAVVAVLLLSVAGFFQIRQVTVIGNEYYTKEEIADFVIQDGYKRNSL